MKISAHIVRLRLRSLAFVAATISIFALLAGFAFARGTHGGGHAGGGGGHISAGHVGGGSLGGGGTLAARRDISVVVARISVAIISASDTRAAVVDASAAAAPA